VPLDAIYEMAAKKKVDVTQQLLLNIYADAKRLWRKMIDPNDPTYITHDTYLKLYELSRPALSQYDIIMLDEAQDSNGVVLSIVGHAKAQKIFVGDPYQQIYSWRGSVNAMDEIYTPQIAHLSQSFRFGKQVASLASYILEEELSCDRELRGFEKVADKIGRSDQPDCIIFRTNSGVIAEAIRQISANKKVHIIGDIAALIRLIDGVAELQTRNRTSHPELMDFISYQDFIEYTESEMGKDLAVIVKLIDENGYAALKTALEAIQHNKEEDSDVILTTAHKSKGREFNAVKLGSDFKKIEELAEARKNGKPFKVNAEEFNLLYVAITRAKTTLDVTELRFFDEVMSDMAY
jgi:superfamily I DNA/RNA helicase